MLGPSLALLSPPRTMGPVITIPSIMGAACIHWIRSDLGVVNDGSGNVLSWADQVSTNHWTPPGAASTRPTIEAAAWNGLPAVVFDGADDWLYSPLTLPLPGTTPSLIMMVVQAVGWTNGDCFTDGDAVINRMKIYQDTASPNIRCYAGSAGPSNANLITPGDPKVIFALFNNSTTDALEVGSVAVTGTNTGNTTTTGRRLGRLGGAGGNYGNFKLLEKAVFDRAMTFPERLQVAAYLSGRYTAAVLA